MADEPKIKSELQQMPDEPLLPVEMSLIRWSIGLGVVLMVVLIWMTYAFFPPAG
jgi:hypothetical protein